MPKRKRIIQLRRCKVCDKPGHNRSTCKAAFNSPALETKIFEKKVSTAGQVPIRQKILSSKLVSNTGALRSFKNAPALKFFIHHVPTQTEMSPHVIDLKTEVFNAWEKTTASGPAKKLAHLYQRYHHIKDTPAKNKNEPLMANLNITDKQLPTKPKFTPTKPKANKKRFNLNNYFSASLFQIKTKLNNLTRSATALAKAKSTPAGSKQFTWRLALKKISLGLTAILVVILVPLKSHSYYQNLTSTRAAIEQNSIAGFLALHESTQALLSANLDLAVTQTDVALTNFDSATTILNSKHQIISKIAGAVPVVGGQLFDRKKLLLAGQEIAVGNSFLLQGIIASDKNETTTLTKRLNILIEHLSLALPNYQAAQQNLNAVDNTVLPLEYQESFTSFQLAFSALVADIESLVAVGDSLQEIFGGLGHRRYLIVFQNPQELRPTGGFIGSLAIVNIKDGKLQDMEVPAGGSYDFQGQLDVHITPPDPLLLVNNRWEFQDSNWHPDFAKSAEKMLWFYRHARQESADGVIAINSSVLERLLAVVGPVTSAENDLILEKDTAIATLRTAIETQNAELNKTPKQVIADFTPIIIESLSKLESTAIVPLLANLQSALEQKEVQAYFTNVETQKLINSFGWGGTITPTTPPQDYLLVVNSNLQGQKSDANIKQHISHQAVVQANGTTEVTVEITKQHTSTWPGDLYDSTNIDYLRVYVPYGSQLIKASGFSWPDEKAFKTPGPWQTPDQNISQVEKEIKIDSRSGTRITAEFGKYAFGNWVITEPGQTSRIQFTYRLPYNLLYKKDLSDEIVAKDTTTYQLIVQRQSGSASTFESQVIFPSNYTPTWKSGRNIKMASNGALVGPIDLVTDSFWSLLLRHSK